ncbi:putative phage tail protein [[Clostridium] colinum]|uniref:putative phage tail protein n=1 Tax=[Clostridium] colinum TaxID=36835 RepID=UPI0020246D6A|nr:putative phage tail protein [[Clostridium] colinum]
MNNRVINFINKIFINDDITKHIARISQTEIENIEIKIDDIKSNIFLDTSTWGLNIFEKELNIEYVEDKLIEERKAIISAKWRGAGKLTLELIQDTVKAYTDNLVKVRFNGTIIIDFTNKIGKPKDIGSLIKSIEDIKPAHLGVDYIFKYRTWGDLSSLTWKSISSKTWKEVRESEKLI